MNPRLIAIAGPMEGAFFALPEKEITIGRDPENVLPIEDDSVSPFHCTIDGSGGGFTIRNRSPERGTFVNCLPVEERELAHGDEVRVGECLFLFLTYQTETPPELRLQRELERLEMENRRLQAAINLVHEMVGDSGPMRAVYRFIGKVAPADSTVLIRGESGTGKELVARAIHRNSPRAGRPFLAINCAAITETLLESELFGHEKGAFTGAVALKRGKLEMAESGTVFLDEVGELAPAMQAKLLRVLQEHQFERVGGTRTIHADLRVIAATNRDLGQSVRASTFRQDLYYRLNVVSILLPPLRERKADILPLANYFAAKFAKRTGRRVLGFSPDAAALITSWDWPGNVRELENAIERAVVLGSTDLILPDDLPDAILEQRAQPSPDGSPGYHEAVDAARRKLILQALRRAGGNCSEAARMLGLQPTYLHRLIRNLDLRPLIRPARQEEAL